MQQSVLIFLVEDEALVREFLQSALEDAGFEVRAAASGEEAISTLDAEASSFRALVTDIDLRPGKLTGWDVARHARELIPAAPVIYTSGGSADQWASMGVPNSVLIQKPYVVAQILTAVSQLLNTGGPTSAANP